MSFIREVLHVNDKTTLEQLNNKIPELTIAVSSCKSDVSTFLDNIYLNFSRKPKNDRILIKKIADIQEEINKLKEDSTIIKDEWPKVDTKIQKNLESLNKLNLTIEVVNECYSIHKSLIEIRELNNQDSLVEAILKIKVVDKKLQEISDGSGFWVGLQQQLNSEKHALYHKLSTIFKEHVMLETKDEVHTITIKTNLKLMQEVMTALYQYETFLSPLDNVTKFLWENFFVPSVDYITNIAINSDTENNSNSLTLTVVNTTKKSDYVLVFARIETIVSFLSSHFNFKLDDNLGTLSYIGRDIRDNLSELLIKHCLEDTVPTTSEGLQQYQIVVDATTQLEKSLIVNQIFAEDTTSILEYANNIDVIFINRKCQEYKQTAIGMMKKDLHEMVEVGVENTGLTLTDFPKCSISKNVLEILKLAEKILVEATKSSSVCAGRLCTIVRNIFESYATFVPEFHKKLLQTIPQQIALFYNNCSYICYQLLKWNEAYLKQLPSELDVGTIFQDEILKLESVASKMFKSYVDGQIKQIHEIIKDSGLQSQQTLQQVETSIEKAMRQCLRQQELLKTVWHKVLPYDLYNKTLGTILDEFCNVLIDSIIKFEDISSDAAEQLVEMLKMVQTRAPKLFTDPKEVGLFVKSWYKLNELSFVLNASLVDINDRWADAKGPLALQFKPMELKQLIRALFQNTERRAALLSKIRD